MRYQAHHVDYVQRLREEHSVYVYACVCVRVRACACVCARMCACVCVCARAFESTTKHTYVWDNQYA